MRDLESKVKQNLARLVDIDVDEIDIDTKLSDDYGLTSLNLVVLVTTLCEETDVPLFKFTDDDVASLKTSRDVIKLFATAAN